ncbi:unnamed protein product [Allacma fusca]|uniref:Integrase catalytic domain-containing protein n=1 Tax=Allacma fusca TaxID=39272 RepID=A0A8J2L0R2_9HEXA|nr:unnamed protein product [Allacma fusca]
MIWAEKIWWRKVQQDSYWDEVQTLQHGLMVERSSKLWKLDIFLDDDGIMRMKGRTIEASSEVAEAVNPVVLDPRSAVRKIFASCLWCRIRKVTPVIPKMADLPPERVTSYGRPFMKTGMDFFGPVYVKVGRKKEKRYGVLFTCLAVRAVHLEVAAKLTTDSAINAIRRFIDRRGTPDDLYTDNGRNMLGAEKELREAMKQMEKCKMLDFAAGKHFK